MIKRLFDLLLAGTGLLFLGWLLLLLGAIAAIDTQSNGLFLQQRIGRFGKRFTILKLQTIHPQTRTISRTGRFLRRSKLDELPQLLNVLLGTMSIVGPRPDIPGYYDQLQGEARQLLELKPGLTSEASLKYANEEALLAQQENPLHYNDTVIFPDKVQLNLAYYYHRSFWGDWRIVWKTVFREREKNKEKRIKRKDYYDPLKNMAFVPTHGRNRTGVCERSF